MHSRRIGTLAIAALVSSLATIPAHAATDGSQVVISEAYGGGGNSGAAYTHDFIELYNPTDADIDLTGYTVEYFSGKGGSGGKATLTGTIPAGGHFLIQGGQGNGGTTALPTPDADAGLTMSGTNGAVQLADAAGTTVDTVGYGSATINEGSPRRWRLQLAVGLPRCRRHRHRQQRRGLHRGRPHAAELRRHADRPD